MFYSFNIACVGPVKAGKSSLIHSANVALKQLVGFNNRVNTGHALLEQGLCIRNVISESTDGTKTGSYDVYKMMDGEFHAGRTSYKGELRFMDTAGMNLEKPGAIRWKDRIVQDEPGIRTSIKAQLVDVAIPDVTLFVFDSVDLFERMSGIGGKRNIKAFLKQYTPLIEAIRTVLPHHPFLVVLTKLDILQKERQGDSLEDIKKEMKSEVQHVFHDVSSIRFVTNYTIPSKKEKEDFAALEEKATRKGTERDEYMAQIEKWQRMNEEHMELLFLATNAARDIQEKCKACAEKTCALM